MFNNKVTERSIYIKTSGSGSQGQEEAACMRHKAYATITANYLQGWQL